MESARKFEHPNRLMRLTLECGHLKLSEASMGVGVIGFSSLCKICSEHKGRSISRQIVKEEETGELGRFNCLEQ
jgi:hypothetical protein